MDPSTLESLLLREIRKANSISRRDLAEQLNVARSTAGRRVDSLIERGFVREAGLEEKVKTGRPKRFLAIRDDAGQFLGFDFDARYVYAVRTDFSLQSLQKKRVRIPAPASKSKVIRILHQLITDFASLSDQQILGYGFGIPGRVNEDSRIAVTYPYIRDWENVYMAAELDIPLDLTRIDNNTRTIAFGECTLGKEAATDHLLCLNIRTGISAAVLSDGQLLRGHHEMAGEIRGWKESIGGTDQSLEDIATVRAIRESGVASNWSDFVKAIQGPDHASRPLFKELVHHHSDTLSRLIQLTDPERVIIAGAVQDLGETYLDEIRNALSKTLTGHYFSPPPIAFVSHGEMSGALGAAALSAHHFSPN